MAKRIRRNADDRLRRLERAAEADEEARERLIAEKIRVGDWHKVFGKNNHQIANSMGYWQDTGAYMQYGLRWDAFANGVEDEIFIAAPTLKTAQQTVFFLERDTYFTNSGIMSEYLSQTRPTNDPFWTLAVSRQQLKFFETRDEAKAEKKRQEKASAESWPSGSIYPGLPDLSKSKIRLRQLKVPVRIYFEVKA